MKMNKKNMILLGLCGIDALVGIVLLLIVVFRGEQSAIGPMLGIGGFVGLTFLIWKITGAMLGVTLARLIVFILVELCAATALLLSVNNIIPGLIVYVINIIYGLHLFTKRKDS